MLPCWTRASVLFALIATAALSAQTLSITVSNVPASASRVVAVADQGSGTSTFTASQTVPTGTGSATVTLNVPPGTGYRVRSFADNSSGLLRSGKVTGITIAAGQSSAVVVFLDDVGVSFSSLNPVTAAFGSGVEIEFSVTDPGDISENQQVGLYASSAPFALPSAPLSATTSISKVGAVYTGTFSLTVPITGTALYYACRMNLTFADQSAFFDLAGSGLTKVIVLSGPANIMLTITNIANSATQIGVIVDGGAFTAAVWASQAVDVNSSAVTVALGVPAGGPYRIRAFAAGASGILRSGKLTSVTAPSSGSAPLSISLSDLLAQGDPSIPVQAVVGATVQLRFNITDPGDVVESGTASLYCSSASFTSVISAPYCGAGVLTKVSSGLYTLTFQQTLQIAGSAFYYAWRMYCGTNSAASYVDWLSNQGQTSQAILLSGSQIVVTVTNIPDMAGFLTVLLDGPTQLQSSHPILSGTSSLQISMTAPPGSGYRVRVYAPDGKGGLRSGKALSVFVPSGGTVTQTVALDDVIVMTDPTTPLSLASNAATSLRFTVTDPGDAIENQAADIFYGSVSFSPPAGTYLGSVTPVKVSAGAYTITYPTDLPVAGNSFSYALRIVLPDTVLTSPPVGSPAWGIALGVSCTYDVIPANVSANAGGSVGVVSVVASSPVCPWNAQASAGWLSTSSIGQPVGSGTLNYSIQPGSLTARSAVLRVGTATVNVAQQAAASNTVTLSPGADLQTAFSNARAGDVILLKSGTYTMLTGEPWFHIDTGITVRALGSVIIQPPTNAPYGLDIRASNTTVDGVTIATAGFGVVARNSNGSVRISNIILHGVTVQNATSGHGILFQNIADSLVENCTITYAYMNGIMLDLASQNVYIVNNTIQATSQQHGITVKSSSGNTIAGNRIVTSGFHGVLLIGAAGNRVERNSITGQRFDGITLDQNGSQYSTNNYIGQNTIARNTQRTDGTGIWLTNLSSGNYLFGNTADGAVEGAFSLFNSSANYLVGNVGLNAGQAGILIWRESAALAAPANNVVHNNYIHDIVANGALLLRGAQNTEVGYNFVTNAFAGMQVASWTGVDGFSGPSTYLNVYQNTFLSLSAGTYIGPDTAATTIYRNRYLSNTNEFSIAPAAVAYDSNYFLGGNYWSNAPGVRPYNKFITDAQTGANNGRYQDRYPFPNESIGDQYSVRVDAPEAGSYVAQGSQKTIAWASRGCTRVDISYVPPAGPAVPLVTNYPDYGFFQWMPGSVPPGNGYTIRVDCKRSDNTSTGVSGTSGAFAIGNGDLVLLSPGRDFIAAGGQSIRVTWKAVVSHPVNVLFRSSTVSSWTVLAAAITGDNVTVALPALQSNRASIAIQATDSSDSRDSVDQHFSIRNGTGIFTAPGSSVTFEIGRPVFLEWISPPGSVAVDLYFWDGITSTQRPIVASLPDFGKYTWLVPDLWSSADYVKAVFRAADNSILGTATSGGTVKLAYSLTPGSLTPLYRVFSEITREHIYTTDFSEYTVLGRAGWSQEGVAANFYNGPRTIDGVDNVPLFRFFNNVTRQHLWTTDRNEYFVLSGVSDWTPEGIAGYVFPSLVTGTTPYYRLLQLGTPYHLWTTDLNEYQFLQTHGWRSEGITGYVNP